MIDRMQELKSEINELNALQIKQLLELKHELNNAISDSLLDLFVNKNSDPNKHNDNPIFIAIRKITGYMIDQTALGKSKNKWAILLQHEIENLMPEIISALVSKKNPNN